MWKKTQKNNLFILLSVLWISLISWFAFAHNLENIGLVDETEPLFVEASRQMLETGDWITPYFNGNTRFDKPPLVYWLMALGFQVFGVSEWVARLPSVLAAIGLTFFSFYTILTTQNDQKQSRITTQITALITVAMVALHPLTIVWARSGVSDMLLTGCMCLSLLCFFLGYLQTTNQPQAISNKKTFYLLFYIFISLAILTKGPIGIVLPILIIGSFSLYLGNWRELWQEMKPIQGLLLVLTISVPWYILVTLANGKEYIDKFFGYHNIERFTQVVNRHSAPIYFYIPVVLIGFFPWSIYLPLAIAKVRFWQRKYWQKQPRNQQLSLFSAVWFFSVFIFFTIAQTKLPSYVLPLMPACAILVGLLWSDILLGSLSKGGNENESPLNETGTGNKIIIANDERRKSINGDRQLATPYQLPTINYLINGILAIILAGIIMISYNWLGTDPAMPTFDQVMENSGLLTIGGVIWLLAGLAIFICIFSKRFKLIWSINFIAFLLFVILVVTPGIQLVDQERQLPLRKLAQTIVQVKYPNEEVVMTGFEKPSLVFYTRGKVSYYRSANATIRYLNSLQGYAQTKPTFLLLGYPQRFADLGLLPEQYQVIDQKGAYQVARVFTAQLKPLSLIPD